MSLAPAKVAWPMDRATDSLIGMGFTIVTVGGMPHLTMPDLVDALLQHNETFINDTIAKYIPADIAPIIVLHELQRVIPQLPTDSITRKMTIFYIALILPTIAVVAARFYARKYIMPKQIRREDWACLVALIFCVMMSGALWAQNVFGHAGNHVWTLSFKEIRDLVRCITGLQVVFVTTHLMVKSAFLVFYYRLSPSPGHKRACHVVAIYIVMLFLTGLFVDIFQCNPVDSWNHLATAKCIKRLQWQEAQGSLFVVADFAILFLPLPAVYTLKLRLREKIMLIGMFGLGGFISITSIIRIISLRQWLEGSDFSFGILWHAKWLVVELDLAVVVMCAPAIKVILFHHAPQIAGSRSRPRSHGPTDDSSGSGRIRGRRSRGRGDGRGIRVGSDTMLSDAYWKTSVVADCETASKEDHDVIKGSELQEVRNVGSNEPESDIHIVPGMVVTVHKDFDVEVGPRSVTDSAWQRVN